MVTKEREVVVVSIPDNLSIDNRDRVAAEVFEKLEEGKKYFAMDCSRTRDITVPSGVSTLLSLQSGVAACEGKIWIEGLNPELSERLKRFRIDQVIPLSRPEEFK